jgi:peptide-methionine (S)-S-oxide reductase
MGASCDVPGGSLRVPPSAFPDPERDIEAGGAGEQAVVLAGGCFWCVEAVLKELRGVLEVVSGYAGGTADTADYRTVCTGATGHAEAVRVRFDPSWISFGKLLKVFFSVAHDPTQRDRQGNDYGTQYRSAIFYAGPEQREVAAAYIRQLDEAGVFQSPIVTRIEPLTAFYAAEDYHQDYAARNPAQPYVVHVAAPKVKKLREYFGARLKGAARRV